MSGIRDRYWNLLDELIQVNEELISSRDDYRNIGAVSFAKEFATVKMNIGRQMGTTTYIAKNATENDCIICLSEVRQMEMKSRINSWRVNLPEVLSLQDLWPVKEKYNKIWIDTGFHIEPSKIQEIYDKFAHRASQFIILG